MQSRVVSPQQELDEGCLACRPSAHTAAPGHSAVSDNMSALPLHTDNWCASDAGHQLLLNTSGATTATGIGRGNLHKAGPTA